MASDLLADEIQVPFVVTGASPSGACLRPRRTPAEPGQQAASVGLCPVLHRLTYRHPCLLTRISSPIHTSHLFFVQSYLCGRIE